MKTTKEIVKKIVYAIVLQTLIYILQYLLIPIIYIPHPMDQTACTLILFFTTIIIIFFGQLFVIRNTWCWIISFPIYPILIKLYHPTDAYGIGYDGFLISFNENFYIILVSLFILIVEVVACIFVKLIQRVRKGK